MTKDEILRQFVDMALPKPCEFGEENFAGDPLVLEFCQALHEHHHLDVAMYVAWRCPPRVMVLRSPVGNVAIRSERLDTLLVEYYRLQELFHVWSDELASEVVSASVLRWMCELLIGFRQPELGIFAHSLRPKIEGVERLSSPFRDEALDSIPEIERVALQCLCLAHEVGHLLVDDHRDFTLEATFDGISLARHIDVGNQQSSLPPAVLEQLRAVCAERLDATNLAGEVEADLFALSSVFDFLVRGLGCTLKNAVSAVLRAFEAQLFLSACTHTCRLLALAASDQLSERDFLERDYLIGVETSVRARAVVRRVGFLWAVREHPDPPSGGRDYNSYVKRVDAMLMPQQAFTKLISDLLSIHARTVFAEIHERSDTSARDAWFHALISRVEHDADVRLDLFYILIAFGCPGGTNVVSYLKNIRRSHHSSLAVSRRAASA